jgi:hypothetical protein
MATKITIALEDDLDGSPASETVRFGLDGVQYELDLNKKNARAFRKKLTPFVEHARKAGPGQRHGPARTTSSRQRSGDIRAWAKAKGLAVSDRGRIPANVVDQYEATTRRPLRTPGHHRHEPIPLRRSPGRDGPVNGVSLGLSAAAHGRMGRSQAGQCEAAAAKTFARTVAVTWASRQRLRPHSARAGLPSAAGNNGRWLHTA